MWDVRGWKRLTVRDEPPLSVVREEFLSWLNEVPDPNRKDLEQRLKNKDDGPHFSARLEIFLHHYFLSSGWEVLSHPTLPNTQNHPDFQVSRDDTRIIVEAKSVLEQPDVVGQENLLRQLADEISRRMKRTIIIESLSELPSGLPANRIRGEIEGHSGWQRDADVEAVEFQVAGDHNGAPYTLNVIGIKSGGAHSPPAGVQGTISPVRKLVIGQQLKEALTLKAGKYGALEGAFVIAVSCETSFPAETRDELAALFGDEVWNLGADRQVTQSWKPNGLFTLSRQGRPRYERVSAIVIYRFKWLEDGHEHRTHMYHNPYARHPVQPELFPEVPQLVKVSDSQMQWINGRPE